MYTTPLSHAADARSSILQGMWAVDKLGRRYTTMYGSIGMAVSQLIVAITGAAVSANNEAGQKVLVAFVCIFIGELEHIFRYADRTFQRTHDVGGPCSSLRGHLGSLRCA